MTTLASSISKLAEIIESMEKGKEYLLTYVDQRIESAMDRAPQDPAIRSLAGVVKNLVKSGRLTISQKELTSLYNQFSPMRATASPVQDLLGDLLYKTADVVNPGATNRAPSTMVDMNLKDNPYNGIFNKEKVASSYPIDMVDKCKKVLAQELSRLQMDPQAIQVFAGNDKAILFDVVYQSKLGAAHLPIPVEFENKYVHIPSSFIDSGNIIELSAENINSYLVKNAKQEINTNTLAKVASSVHTADDYATSIQMAKAKIPTALQNMSELETSLSEASTQYPFKTVQAAKQICEEQFKMMGIPAQIRFDESINDCIVCKAELDSCFGKTAVKVPVEIVNGSPQIPTLFYREEDKLLDLNRKQLAAYLTSLSPGHEAISRYAHDTGLRSYAQLKDELLQAAINKDFDQAEQSLSVIEDKYGTGRHREALMDYMNFLKTAESHQEQKCGCKLILNQNGLVPRCGHLNVPITKVAQDDMGRCYLIERQAKYDNMDKEGATCIGRNKIIIS